ADYNYPKMFIKEKRDMIFGVNRHCSLKNHLITRITVQTLRITGRSHCCKSSIFASNILSFPDLRNIHS
ncbi:MAG: hypothetical protein LBH60_09250, partial [Prevotellaceae bacterium]|nr:hypothetical protein [Prevotellaceae bacterium]